MSMVLEVVVDVGLQIAAHLAWLSQPEQEGDVFIMITAFPSRGGFMTILPPGNKK